MTEHSTIAAPKTLRPGRDLPVAVVVGVTLLVGVVASLFIRKEAFGVVVVTDASQAMHHFCSSVFPDKEGASVLAGHKCHTYGWGELNSACLASSSLTKVQGGWGS